MNVVTHAEARVCFMVTDVASGYIHVLLFEVD